MRTHKIIAAYRLLFAVGTLSPITAIERSSCVTDPKPNNTCPAINPVTFGVAADMTLPSMEQNNPTRNSVLRPNRSARGPTKGARAPTATVEALNNQTCSSTAERSCAIIVPIVR